MNQPIVTQSQITDVDFGINVRLIAPVNLYGCRLGDNCLIEHIMLVTAPDTLRKLLWISV